MGASTVATEPSLSTQVMLLSIHACLQEGGPGETHLCCSPSHPLAHMCSCTCMGRRPIECVFRQVKEEVAWGPWRKLRSSELGLGFSEMNLPMPSEPYHQHPDERGQETVGAESSLCSSALSHTLGDCLSHRLSQCLAIQSRMSHCTPKMSAPVD